MTRPQVTVHSMASADGRTDHFAGDVGLYYELAAGFPQDAVLTGSGTLVAAAASQGVSLDCEDQPPDQVHSPEAVWSAEFLDPRSPEAQKQERPRSPEATETKTTKTTETAKAEAETAGADRDGVGGGTLPLLVVLDSRGRLTRFRWLRAMPYWRDILVLCSASTPPAHLELLERHRVPYLVTGADRVDIPAALATLSERYAVRHVRVDSGGSLNGVLLRKGLVDEISILLGPYAVGGRSARGLFVADDLPGDGELAGEAPTGGTVADGVTAGGGTVADGVTAGGGTVAGGVTAGGVTALELRAVERLRGDVVWLRYRVTHAG